MPNEKTTEKTTKQKTLEQAVIDLCVARADIEELKEKNGRQSHQLNELQHALGKKEQLFNQLETKYTALLEEHAKYEKIKFESLPSKRSIKFLTYFMGCITIMQFVFMFVTLSK